MEDLTGLGKLADSKLINDVYQDGLAKAAKETGNSLEDITKAFRLFLAPVQLMAVAQDRLSAFCDRVRSSVPEERHQEAASSVAGPVLLELRYMEDENPITELYLNLLRRAIDKDRYHQAHPAFVKIIGQLCPEEALLLHCLADSEFKLVEYRYGATEDFPLQSIAWSDCPIDDLQVDSRLSMYLEHLEGLNLVHYGIGTREKTQQVPEKENCVVFGARAKLTSFGRLFTDACEP